MDYGTDFYWRIAGFASPLGFALIGLGAAYGLPPDIWFGTAIVTAALFAASQAIGITRDDRKQAIADSAIRAARLYKLGKIIVRGKALILQNPFDSDQYESAYQDYSAWHNDAKRICAELGAEYLIDASGDVQTGGAQRPNTRVKRWSWVQDRIEAQLAGLRALKEKA